MTMFLGVVHARAEVQQQHDDFGSIPFVSAVTESETLPVECLSASLNIHISGIEGQRV